MSDAVKKTRLEFIPVDFIPFEFVDYSVRSYTSRSLFCDDENDDRLDVIVDKR